MSDQAAARTDRRRLVLWIGATGAGLVALAGMAGFHDGSVWRLPQVLQGRVEAALSAVGLPGVEVDMRGQEARLSGVVANHASVDAARQAALTSAGAGGLWAGGVTSVDVSGLKIGPIERPFVFTITREPSRVILSGAVPSDATRRALRAAAAEAFPNAAVLDSMHVAGGSPSAHWRDAVIGAIGALPPFTGQVQFSDDDIAFTVQGTQQAIAELHQNSQHPLAPFNLHINATATP